MHDLWRAVSGETRGKGCERPIGNSGRRLPRPGRHSGGQPSLTSAVRARSVASSAGLGLVRSRRARSRPARSNRSRLCQGGHRMSRAAMDELVTARPAWRGDHRGCGCVADVMHAGLQDSASGLHEVAPMRAGYATSARAGVDVIAVVLVGPTLSTGLPPSGGVWPGAGSTSRRMLRRWAGRCEAGADHREVDSTGKLTPPGRVVLSRRKAGSSSFPSSQRCGGAPRRDRRRCEGPAPRRRSRPARCRWRRPSPQRPRLRDR